jgi:hypothetical protein
MSDQAARFAKDRKPAGSVQPHRAASAAGRTGDRRVTGGAPAPGPVAERGRSNAPFGKGHGKLVDRVRTMGRGLCWQPLPTLRPDLP